MPKLPVVAAVAFQFKEFNMSKRRSPGSVAKRNSKRILEGRKSRKR